jgi:lipopolysaccharide export system protein LptA
LLIWCFAPLAWSQGTKKEIQGTVYLKEDLPAVQPDVEPIDTVGGVVQRIELIYAGELEGDVLESGENIRIVRRDEGRQVQFRQKNIVMFCDTAYQYVERNHIEAYGRIKLIENDSVTLTADTLYYNGKTRVAEFWGNVILQDQEKTVITRRLNYDMHRRVAYYYDGGTVYDKQSRLTSQRGYYNTDSKLATFGGDVKVRGSGNYVDGDSITYDTNTKIAYFDATTTIISGDGSRIVAQEGTTYNTVTGVMKNAPNAKGRTKIENNEYIIDAKFVDFDNVKEKGVASGDGSLFEKKETTTLFGEEAYYDGVEKRLDAYDNALLIRPMGADTLFLAADTIIAYNDTLPERQRMYAYRNVRIFKSDFQAICDSLTYDFADTLIYFDYDPFIWADQNQLSGKRITARLGDKDIEGLDIKERAFVVSKNLFGQFDQIKGRDLQAVFEDSNLKTVLVDGNGENIYHLVEESKDKPPVWKGLNYIKCSNIHIHFADSNKIKEIRFIQNPEGKVIPPQLVTEKNNQLENFQWKEEQRPSRESLLANRNPAEKINADPPPNGELIVDKDFQVYYDAKNGKITFYKLNAQPEEFSDLLYLIVYPEDVNELPEQSRSAGYFSPLINVIPEMIKKGATFRYSPKIPPFKIRKIVAGQRSQGMGDKWSGSYTVPIIK